MKKMLIVLTVLLVFVSACSPQSSTTHPTAETVPPTVTVLPVVTQTPAPTATSLIAIPAVSEQCIPTAGNSFSGVLKGTIVFDDNSNFSLILKRGNELRIPEQPNQNNNVLRTFVSPSGKYLGYDQQFPDDFHLMVRQADGSIVQNYGEYDLAKSFGSNYNWYSIRWVGDDSILFATDNSASLAQSAQLLILLDINTGSHRELETGFPQIASGKEVNWDIDDLAIGIVIYGVNIVYDPSLARVVYPKAGDVAVLYDVQHKLELASMPLENATSPVWSPDGKFFSIIAKAPASAGEHGDEFFIVARDGPEFKRLTYLGNLYPSVSIGAYNWSPDSRKIAFWMKPKDAQEYSLAVLDVNSGAVTNYCLTGIASRNSELFSQSHPGPVVGTGKPVWSPDGTKLLISQFDEAHKHINVMLVDLAQGQAFKLSQDVEPIGWLKAGP